MTNAPSTIELIVREVASALLRLSEGLYAEDLRRLIEDLGWQAPESLATIGLNRDLIEAVVSAYTAVVEMELEKPDDMTAQENYQALRDAVTALAVHLEVVVSGVTQYFGQGFLTKTGLTEEDFESKFRKRLTDYLIVEYLRAVKPPLFYLLRMLGIVELQYYRAVDDILQSEHTRRVVHYERIQLLLTDPGALFSDVNTYGWGTSTADLNLLLERLHDVLLTLGLPAYLDYPDLAKEINLSKPVTVPEEGEAQTLDLCVPVFRTDKGDLETEIGFTLFPVPALSSNEAPGLALCPYASGEFEALIPLDESDQWFMELSGNLEELKLGIGIILRPGEDIRAITDLLGTSTSASGSFLMKVRRVTWPDEPLVLFSLDDGSGLSLREIYIGSGVALGSDQQLDIIAELGCLGFSFVLKGTGDDSFLSKILPEEGIRADFDLILGWSREQGIYFRGSFGLEVKLPTHISLGPVVINGLWLAVRTNGARSIPMEVSASVTGRLGPVIITIERIGCAIAIGFPESGGKLGLLDASLDFKRPESVGLSIDASGITGGGFLEFDDANKRYTGVLTLNFGEIGLTAIGLITTKMPDGSEGFALLINIGTTFNPPMQLSMGFNLSGVGGLIGVNRSMEIDALRTGLKNRTLDSILFPDPSTVIANASKIISDLRTVFPPAEERYVVGPMVKIGWGSPTIITADIGIFLEFPNPVRIVLLGQVEAALPEQKKALVVIHLDVLGVLEFAKEELTFQASLYDSRILSFALFGDSAFLLGWGCDPRFALSLGGFHPKFTPPPPPIVFAGLKRLTLDIGTGSKLQLACRAYLALTPNSLQFGARVDLYASAGGFTAEGHLGFDALLYLSPFSFEVEIRGGVHLKYKGLSLFGINLTLLLSGPTPWHARGKAKISLLFFSIKVGFSITWGESEKVTLAPIDAWQPLQDALAAAGNWGSILPVGRTLVESLRGFEEEASGKIIVHPAGRLEVRQNVVPLGICLDKVGNAPITGHDRFDIEDLIVDDKSLNPEPVQEFFARGQFEELTSDQKLSVPSFERMKGGVTTAASETVRIDGRDDVVEDKPITYESILIKRDSTSELQQLDGVFEWEEAQFIVAAGITRKAIRRAGPRKRFSSLHPRPKVGVPEEAYCIANAEDLTRATLSSELDHENRNMTRMAADQVLRAQIELEPEQANNLLVVPEYEVYEVMA